MHKQRGFTLVEILFVVLIAAGILAFAVPAYKRVQEKADYNAAVGILLDVSNAVRSLKQDLRGLSSKNISFPRESGEAWAFSDTSSIGNFYVAGAWNQHLVDTYIDDEGGSSGSGSDDWSSGSGSDDWGSGSGSDDWGSGSGSEDWNSGSGSESGSGSGSETWDTQFWSALFKFGYLKKIPSTKGYSMYVVNKNSSAANCGVDALPETAVACMLKSGTKEDCYKGAIVLEDGSVQRVKGAQCKN